LDPPRDFAASSLDLFASGALHWEASGINCLQQPPSPRDVQQAEELRKPRHQRTRIVAAIDAGCERVFSGLQFVRRAWRRSV
jgi:hypothetical protein